MFNDFKIEDYLTKRYEWEELTSNFNIPEEHRQGTVNSLEWFIKNGHKANSLRNGFDKAMQIANLILGDIHGSSKETTKRV